MVSVAQTLAERTETYTHDTSLTMMPALRTIVIGCVDPRVDPELLLGVQLGEVAVIRNVGGRVTPAVLEELVLLRAVTQAAGSDLGSGWELIVLQHTQCGIVKLVDAPGLPAHLGVAPADLASAHVTDPHAAVARDVALLRAETRLGAGVVVSGLVFDVTTGRVASV